MSMWELIVLGAAGFFVFSWTIGLFLGKAETLQMQLAVICLWPVYLPAIFGVFTPLHLIWALPVTVIVAFFLGTVIVFRRINKRYQD